MAMIKKILLLFVLTSATILNLKAQDTSAYELQRAKINALLAERSAKFGQYDKSLTTKTGIFGFQTKKDIRNSNEILRQIVLNDNEIFTQLKVLMDYKDLQAEQIKSTVNTNSESILSYRRTIKQLQDQSKKLTKELDKAEASSSLAHLFMGLSLIGCIVLTYFLNKNRLRLKNYESKSV
jgi:hypothetical protein